MFLEHLLLWVHLAVAIFCVGPVTVATSFTPRYIRSGQLQVVRFLRRMTVIFGLLTLLVFASGLGLGRDRLGQPWLTASMTLFVVAFALLFAIVQRDQAGAIRALEARADAAPPVQASPSTDTAAARADDAAEETATAEPVDGPEAAREPTPEPTREPTPEAPRATVQTGRIAAFSAVIAAIWLVILVFMVWRPGA